MHGGAIKDSFLKTNNKEKPFSLLQPFADNQFCWESKIV